MKTLLIALIGSYYNVISYFSKTYAANRAILLFSKPRKGKITEEQEDFLGTAFQEELKFDKIPIMTYRWLGKKKTVLMVHGWESNSARWKNLILQLKQQGFNFVALDAPAHGHSGSKVFNAFLYSEFIHIVAKHFQPHVIIGHSVGGMATVFCQNKYHLKSVQKLILIGSPSEYSGLLERYTTMMGYNQRIIKQINAIIIERLGAEPSAFSSSKYLKTISSQGLIIHDEDDTVIPYCEALQIKNSFKGSTLITTKGLGHSLNNDAVASYIYDFLEA
ncbi:alpha/beta hydrolase [Flavobacteriaceae bacterium LMO-SS05]